MSASSVGGAKTKSKERKVSAPSVDEGLLKKIDRIQLSGRLKSLKDKYISATPVACGERAKVSVESFKQTEGEPIDLRFGKLQRMYCEKLPIVIWDGELTAGSPTRVYRGAYPDVEWDAEYLPQVTEGTGVTFGGPEHKGIISEQDWKSCVEAITYFKGKTPAELVRQSRNAILGSWYDDVVKAQGTGRFDAYSHGGGAIPVYEKLLATGLRGVIQEAEAGIQRFKELREHDPEKLYFWQSVIIACEGVITLAGRYAKLAREMASKEQNQVRKGELEKIAAALNQVPEKPARTFHEAIQSMHILHLALGMQNTVGSANHGRMDQYLYPYFKKDLAEGRLTVEEAADLLGGLVSYFARLEWVREKMERERAQSTPITQLTIGGVDKNGEDASNELSYLIIHVLGLLGYAEPHASLRWNPKTPRWLLMKGLDANRKVGGIPMYVNDVHVMNYLMERGVSLEAARDWKLNACSQPVAAPQNYWFGPTNINAPLCLDLALHNGVASITGKKLGIETGDSRTWTSFEQVMEAFKKQYEFFTRRLLWSARIDHLAKVQRWRVPLYSAVSAKCVENGKDLGLGGNGFDPLWYVKDRGFVDLADSMMAIKKVVFEDSGKVSMSDLVDALDSDFGGVRGEEIQHLCLVAPKYGNDVDEVDCMARDLGKFSAGIIFSEKTVFGQPYAINRPGVAWHYGAGKGVGALPNGRKAKAPLADGSLSPEGGMDRNGPTAALNSAIKADFKEAANVIMNQKFPLALVQDQQNLEKVASLTETFLRKGGIHIQYNFLDKTVLLDAKKHPERYRDLVVRVAGYSAYFVLLSPEVQDEIIRRTEQTI